MRCNRVLTNGSGRCRIRRLPKGMKDWPAFIDLKQKIDDFNEMCPLLEMMANKAMKDRHWARLSKLTEYDFDIESETFSLKNVIEAPLLKYKDDVEVRMVATPPATVRGEGVNAPPHVPGHLHKRRQGEGHRSETEAGHSRLVSRRAEFRPFQSERGVTAQGAGNRRNHRAAGRQFDGPFVSPVEQVKHWNAIPFPQIYRIVHR